MNWIQEMCIYVIGYIWMHGLLGLQENMFVMHWISHKWCLCYVWCIWILFKWFKTMYEVYWVLVKTGKYVKTGKTQFFPPGQVYRPLYRLLYGGRPVYRWPYRFLSRSGTVTGFWFTGLPVSGSVWDCYWIWVDRSTGLSTGLGPLLESKPPVYRSQYCFDIVAGIYMTGLPV